MSRSIISCGSGTASRSDVANVRGPFGWVSVMGLAYPRYRKRNSRAGTAADFAGRHSHAAEDRQTALYRVGPASPDSQPRTAVPLLPALCYASRHRGDDAFIRRIIMIIDATSRTPPGSRSALSYQTYSDFGVSPTARIVPETS